MNWKDIGQQIASIAPVLGAALGGPVGGAAGALIASVFGVAQDDPTAVSKAIKADPESAIKLLALEQEHERALLQMASDERKAEMLDTQQARTTHRDSWVPWALTLALVVMVSAMVAALVLLSIPEGNREVVYLIVGQLLGAFATATSYWLGSSKSSVNKDAMLRQN